MRRTTRFDFHRDIDLARQLIEETSKGVGKPQRAQEFIAPTLLHWAAKSKMRLRCTRVKGSTPSIVPAAIKNNSGFDGHDRD
jgi:hypothetical protein